MTPVKISLAGIGGFGANHLRSLQLLRQRGLVEVVAVADPAQDKYPETTLALRKHNVAQFLDFSKMLEKTPGLEAVILCTPIPLHKDMAAEALRRGLYVYLEKPPVIVRSDLQDLIQLDSEGRTSVGFIGVSPPIIRKTKARAHAGALGKLREIRIAASWPRPSLYYQRSGWAGKLHTNGKPVFDGPATNALSHYVHLATFLASEDPAGHTDVKWLKASLYRARPIESYDTCSIHGEFANGVAFGLTLTHACRHRTDVDVRLVGSQSSANLSIGQNATRSDLVDETEAAGTILDANLTNFIRGIREGERFFTTLPDCLPFLDIVSGMWLSSSGIHSIDPAYITTWNDEPDTLFHISDMETVLARSLEGTPLSEMELPWTVESRCVSAGEIAGFDLRQALAPAEETGHGLALKTGRKTGSLHNGRN